MSKIRKSLFFSVIEKYIIFFIQFIATIFIARLLTPVELGIFSVASLIISFSHIFRDLGISNYVIQEKNLSNQRLQTAQTILFLSSWVLAFFVAVSSTYFSRFYSEPKVQDILLVLSINFLILPFGALNSALLKREMLFDRVIKINISAAIAQTSSAIYLCYSGHGPLGLAWSGVIGTSVTILMTRYHSPIKVPFLPSLNEWRHVLSIGGRYSAASILWEIGSSGPELISGKVIGIESAGYLGRAQGIIGLAYRTIMEGLSPVLLPHFAEIHRNNGNIGNQFLISLSNLSVFTLPIFLSMIFAMDSLVLLLYGNQWHNTILPAQIICFGMLFLSIATTAGSAVAGMGEAKYSLRFQLLAQPVKLLLVLIGCQFSLEYVAAGMAAGEIVLSIYTVIILRKLSHFDWLDFFNSVRASVLVALLTAGTCLIFRVMAQTTNEFWIAFGCIISSAIAWIIAIKIAKHPIRHEINKLASALWQKTR